MRWASVSALALALGPIAGGVLAQIDWRLIFLINLPLLLFAFVVISREAPNVRDETSAARIDLPGVILLSLGLGALTLGFAQAEDWGWGSLATLATIGLGFAALLAFWRVEHRVSNPIVEFDLFRNKPYFGASAAAFTLVGSYWVVMFFQPQYLQDILGYSPAAAGALILPVTLPMVFISLVADRVVRTAGVRNVMGGGMLLGVAGLFLMGRVDADSTYASLFLGYSLFGLALGFVYAPMQTAAMSAMPQAKAGIASGVLAMNRILSGALSLAITASLFHTVLREKIQSLAGGQPLTEADAGELEGLANGTSSAQATLAEQGEGRMEALTAAVDDAFAFALSDMLWFPTVLTAIGAVLAWAYVRSPGDEQPAAQPPDHHRHKGRFHL